MKKILITLTCLLLTACAHKSEVASKTTQPENSVVNLSLSPAQTNRVDFSDSRLQVALTGGRVDFNNIDAYAAYEPVHFSLDDGETKAVTITKAGDNFFDSSTMLTASFKDGTLSLDTKPNPFGAHRGNNPAREITYSPTWRAGETYKNINSQGEASLDQVTVTILLTRKGS